RPVTCVARGESIPRPLSSVWMCSPSGGEYARSGCRPRTALNASAQWKTWTSWPRRHKARARRSTYAASPPKLCAPKNVVTMQNFNGDLPVLDRCSPRPHAAEGVGRVVEGAFGCGGSSTDLPAIAPNYQFGSSSFSQRVGQRLRAEPDPGAGGGA